MPVKFVYNAEYGLQIEGEDGAELTNEQAMILALRDLASGMDSLARAHWDLEEEFRFKKFYNEDVARVPAIPPKAQSKKSAKMKRAAAN